MCVYLDDILVTGSLEREHLDNLAEVLKRLESAGMRLKRSKCEFMLPSVEYLGHKISDKGLQPTEGKIKAIVEAPAPQNVSQLKAFLGMLNYYAKFLPNISSRLATLHKLLQKAVMRQWHFTIYSDHKPLQHLFNENKAIPAMASARIQQWALVLSAYNYDIVFKPGSQNANADVLTRLPLADTPSQVPLPEETVLLLEALQLSPITAAQIKAWTDHDPILSQVRDLVMKGWTMTTNPELSPYQPRKDELSTHDGCLLWGSRVIVPPPGCNKVMADLREGHPGICRMKQLARCYMWWPNMDHELEQKVKECNNCQMMQKSPAQIPMHPWEWPEYPWSRLHTDYAGPFLGKMFLVTVDAHSKWIEANVVDSATSTGTIRKLRQMFTTHGIPEIIVSDNGSVFTSKEFQ